MLIFGLRKAQLGFNETDNLIGCIYYYYYFAWLKTGCKQVPSYPYFLLDN